MPTVATLNHPLLFMTPEPIRCRGALYLQQPLRDKVRVFLELQRQNVPLIARQRPLRPGSGRGRTP